jgi:hypothetical protein
MDFQVNEIDFLEHSFHDNDWIGLVINNLDTTYSGRCQIRVFGLMDNIIADHLPWFVPINSTVFAGDGAGSLSVPKIGQIVRVQFNNGEISGGEFTTIQNIDTQLIEKIKDDYPGTHVLLYDPDVELSIIFQPKSGLQIFYKESFFQISPDSLITIQTPNNDSVIQLDSDKTSIVTKNEVNVSASAKCTVNADEVIIKGNNTTKIGSGNYYHGILAEPLFALLTTLATTIDAKFSATPGICVQAVQSAKQACVSQNVLISS